MLALAVPGARLPSYMREIPDVLCQEGVSTGLNGGEVCLFVIFPHGDRCCFPPRGHFFWAFGGLGLWVCLCFMILCWVFSFPTSFAAVRGSGVRDESTCTELWNTNKHLTATGHLESLSCFHNPNDVLQGCTGQCDIACGLPPPPQ